jgi:hypothetical protein
MQLPDLVEQDLGRGVGEALAERLRASSRFGCSADVDDGTDVLLLSDGESAA